MVYIDLPDEPQAENTLQSQPPIVIAGFRASGMITRMYTLLFFHDCVVFAKTGTIVPNKSKTLITMSESKSDNRLIANLFNKIIAFFSQNKTISAPELLLPLTPQGMALAHKHNFVLKYNDIKSVIIKKPNWLGGVKILIVTFETRIFFIDNVSKLMWYYILKTFENYMPTKVNR